MDENVINNVASHYAYEYGLTDRLDELKESWQRAILYISIHEFC